MGLRALVLIWLCVLSCAASACQLVARAWDFAPQYFLSGQGQWQGMAIEIVDALMKEAGCVVMYKSIPWARAHKELRKGNLDLMMNLSKTPQRQTYLYFIGPVRDEVIKVITLAELPYELRTLDDFKRLPRPVAAEAGAYFGTEFENKRLNDSDFKRKIAYSSRNENYAALLSKARFSGYLDDMYSLMYFIKANNLSQRFKVQPIIVNQSQVYLGVSKMSVSVERKQRLAQALLRIQAKGEIEKILRRYQ